MEGCWGRRLSVGHLAVNGSWVTTKGKNCMAETFPSASMACGIFHASPVADSAAPAASSRREVFCLDFVEGVGVLPYILGLFRWRSRVEWTSTVIDAPPCVRLFCRHCSGYQIHISWHRWRRLPGEPQKRQQDGPSSRLTFIW